ncbi:ribosome small subunit-dependent GTPase A [soil metagenome]
MEMSNKGRIIRSTGSWYQVELLDTGIQIDCRLVGKIRQDDLITTNPIAVGDIVELDMKDGEPIICKVEPRKNYIARQSPRKKHDIHLLASNIDQAIIMSTIVNPDLKLGFIDRFILMTEPRDIPVYLVFNKADIYNEDSMEIYHAVKSIYERIGYSCLLVSTFDGTGLEELKTLLTNKISLIAGQSGVGKSSLINAIEPALNLRTGEISDYTGKGQHTTTFAEMLPFSFGGAIIDTPGIKTLSFNNMEVLDVVHNYKEFFAISDGCKFSNCTHRNEPGCAVKLAIEKGIISELRYATYLQILDEIEDQNYWERHNM